MFAEQLRRAVEASPRVELPKVSALLWKAYAAGYVSESDAADLSALIEARKAAGSAPRVSSRRLVGSRPRTPESLARQFTAAETAVLAVIAAEALRHGRCTLVIEHIAALAGVGRSTVKRALRAAQGLGFVRIEERRVSAWRNAPNVVTIVSREWASWLKMRRRGVGSNSKPPRIQETNKSASAQRNRTWAAERQVARP